MLAHVAGVPVEELLAFVPTGVAVGGALAAQHAGRLRRRLRGTVRR